MNAQLASLDPMEGCLRPLHVSPLTSSGPRRGVVAVFSSSKGQQRASRTRPPVHPRVVAQFGTISVRTTGVQHDEHQRAPTNAYDEATHRSPICSFIRENADERRPAPTAVGALITRRSQVQILPPPPSNTSSEALFARREGPLRSPVSTRCQCQCFVGDGMRAVGFVGVRGPSAVGVARGYRH